MEKNYYQILQVDKEASLEIIEKAYKTLVKKYHPDLQNKDNQEEAEATIKLINEAYETLSNKEKRYEYDQKLKENNIIIQNEPKPNTNYNHTSYSQNTKKEKNVNDYILDIFAALITISILLILFKIPFIQDLFIPHF